MANHHATDNEVREKRVVIEASNGVACPFIAQKGDPDTHYAFASAANYCHQVNPIEPIALSYQRTVCLTDKFNNCPVYLGTWKSSLPPEIRAEVVHQKRSLRRTWLWLLSALAAMVIIWILINPTLLAGWLPASSAAQEYSYVLPTDSKTPTVTSTIQATLAVVPTSTGTNGQSLDYLTVTPSPTPSVFYVPTLGPFFMTPFGPHESFLIHRVHEGESVSKIAEMYDTSNDVIIAVNGLEGDYYFFGEVTNTPGPVLTGPYISPTPTIDLTITPTKTIPPEPTKPGIPTPTKEWNPTITVTGTPYETPDVWTVVLVHPGDILVILPGVKDPLGVDRYQAIYIDTATKVDDLARFYDMTGDEFRYLNSLGPGSLIAVDRWIVVPYKDAGAPPTPHPTLIATIDFSKALTPRFGPTGEYVLHMVRPGESIPQIAAMYHTTEDVLDQANYLANSFTPLQPGDVLVILPGRKEAKGVKLFGTLLVDEDIPIGELASTIRVFESDLTWFNNLEDDQIVPAGRWLIYPREDPRPTRTPTPTLDKTP